MSRNNEIERKRVRQLRDQLTRQPPIFSKEDREAMLTELRPLEQMLGLDISYEGGYNGGTVASDPV